MLNSNVGVSTLSADGAEPSIVVAQPKKLQQRAAVRKLGAAEALSMYYPAAEQLLSPKPRNLIILQRFFRLARTLRARPKMHVAYKREAWMHPQNNTVRVTMDRQIRGEPVTDLRFTTHMLNEYRPVLDLYRHYAEQVMLELKYTDHFPHWFTDLVQRFDLIQIGSPKYGRCIETVGVEQMSRAGDWNSATAHAWIQKYF